MEMRREALKGFRRDQKAQEGPKKAKTGRQDTGEKGAPAAKGVLLAVVDGTRGRGGSPVSRSEKRRRQRLEGQKRRADDAQEGGPPAKARFSSPKRGNLFRPRQILCPSDSDMTLSRNW